MRLPRRVPWGSLQELDQVCAWIYADENDIDAKVRAVNRLSAWKNITSLPHALDSTHAILSSIIQDATSSSLRAISTLTLRQSYATAVIRLVNGLVDPLQLGAYARSISSIASQLGLPHCLVELRHAATHEDLPSLEVLREAARNAMTWLLNNYFLPTLYPTTQPAARTPLRSLAPVLNDYKKILKITTRDASLRAQYQPDITKAIRDIERWIAEAKVASNASAGAFYWEPDTNGSTEDPEPDPKERWALERFCDYLLEKGVLVPLSKKKRAVTTSMDPPMSSVAIWTPLLAHLQTLHPSLPSILVYRIISHLLSSSQSPPEPEEEETLLLAEETAKWDLSYDLCLASWVKHAIDTWGIEAPNQEPETELKRSEVVARILSGFGPQNSHRAEKEKGIRALLTALCTDDPALRENASLFLSPSNLKIPSTSSLVWNEDDLDSMNARLQNLTTTVRSATIPTNISLRPAADIGSNVQLSLGFSSSPSAATSMDVDGSQGPLTLAGESFPELPLGWRSLSEKDGWGPSPIGIYVAAVPASQ